MIVEHVIILRDSSRFHINSRTDPARAKGTGYNGIKPLHDHVWSCSRTNLYIFSEYSLLVLFTVCCIVCNLID
ncbi:transmembrane protein, putative [Medicago truncatula]|uniref:Transmembrane protein, putative n=1 Tax=Medicago truncatula TaxID=3880 RepID=G7L7P3_MEDTR|nr:transmembrane protein, putative [Medicago truncatula]KEH19260.1 transmembrane protein, putative [Medicago truncatula]